MQGLDDAEYEYARADAGGRTSPPGLPAPVGEEQQCKCKEQESAPVEHLCELGIRAEVEAARDRPREEGECEKRRDGIALTAIEQDDGGADKHRAFREPQTNDGRMRCVLERG